MVALVKTIYIDKVKLVQFTSFMPLCASIDNPEDTVFWIVYGATKGILV